LSLDRAVEYARAFHAHNNPPWPFVESDMRETLQFISENGFLKVTGKGFIAATLHSLPISKNWVIASEFLWWGDAHLVRQYRKWAIERGANEIRYSCPPGSRAEGFYRKISAPCEAVYSELI
jgi:hypothetical protein